MRTQSLSRREMQIADLIHQGKIEKEIADDLSISAQTVHSHAKHIREKLGARNIADITRIYLTRLKITDVVIFIIISLGLILFEEDLKEIMNFLYASLISMP